MKTMKWLALASLVLLSACGGGGSGDPTGQSVTASTATTKAPASAASDLRKALTAARIQAAAPERTADQLMDFAQSSAYAGFFPGNPSTQSYPPFRYRTYSNGVLLGVVVTDGMGYTMNGVYAMGGDFGDSPVYVGLVTDFIAPTDTDAFLTFTPSTLKVTGYAGESQDIDIYVQENETLSEIFNVGVVDTNATFTRVSASATFNPGQYMVKLRLSSSLAVGQHSGQLEVRLCRDSAAICANQYPGSTVQLPYQVTIESGTDLKTLRPLPGAAAWSGLNGNAARNAHVAAQVRPDAFSRRFKWNNLRNYGTPGLAIADGRVVSMDSTFSTIRAHSEASGQVVWETKPADASWGSSPVIQGGRVYSMSGWSSTLFAFDAATGQEVGRYPLVSNYGGSPVAVSGKILMSSDRGIHRLDAATGAVDWHRADPALFGWGMAANPTHIYAFNGIGLSVINVVDGSLSIRVANPNHNGLDSAPVVLGDSGAYVAHRDRLKKFDTARAAVAWEVQATNWFGGQGFSDPVLADGVLYVATDGRLEARSPQTGALQWSWTAPRGTTGQLVVVGSHAFVGTAIGTYAVDLSTRQTVWSYPASGMLAVSPNGILYIAPPGSLVAINLH